MSPITRRAAITNTVAAALCTPSFLRALQAPDLPTTLRRLESAAKGRLGCAILDTGAKDTAINHLTGLRLDERFPMCSTFKFSAAAFVLHRVDRKQEKLDRRIIFTKADLLPYAPVAEKHLGAPGLTIAEICEAAVTLSDNTCANAMLASFGGPAALTAYLRSTGDPTTRLDRNEPALNTSTPGDPRDTTSPAAMARTMQRHLLGDALSPASRAQLTTWVVANQTGNDRLRAGLPKSWRVGDKTGTGDNGSTNDIAILWPPNRSPIIVTAFLTETAAPIADRQATLAAIARAVAQAF